MTTCIFCKIQQKEIPSYPIYEDDLVYAFLDISQTTKGHTLVIPKTHVENIFECEENLAGQLFSRVPKIARALEKAFPEMQGLNIVSNNREFAYQSVFHLHIHLIPRFNTQDTFEIRFSNHTENYSTFEMNQIAESIRNELEEK